MRIDHTRTPAAKARAMSSRTARKVKRARVLAGIFLVTMFPAENAFAASQLEG